MIRNLYLILVVGTRTAALFLILSGLLQWVTSLLIAGGSGLGIPLLALVVPVVAGLVLWFLAKPIASLATSGLE